MGEDIGLVGDIFPDPYVHLEGTSALLRLDVRSGSLLTQVRGVDFADPGCQGQPYIDASGTVTHRVHELPGADPRRFFAARREPAQEVTTQSFHTGGAGCEETPRTLLRAVAADEIFLEDFGLSFPLPAPLFPAAAPLAE